MGSVKTLKVERDATAHPVFLHCSCTSVGQASHFSSYFPFEIVDSWVSEWQVAERLQLQANVSTAMSQHVAHVAWFKGNQNHSPAAPQHVFILSLDNVDETAAASFHTLGQYY